MKATIYIPEDSAYLYQKAKEVAHGNISKLFLKFLASEMGIEDAKDPSTHEKILIELQDIHKYLKLALGNN